MASPIVKISYINRAREWTLDYMYVAWRLFLSITTRDSPEHYRSPGGTKILIIPGVYENWLFMRPLIKKLHAMEFDIYVLPELRFNSGTVEDMAEIAAKYMNDLGINDITIVAHSKGGLIGKQLLMKADKPGRLRGMIAINTPFSGSTYAKLLPFRSLRVFIPNSKLLLGLAENLLVDNRIVSIYSTFDPHIPEGSELHGAKNIRLENSYGHFKILKDEVLFTSVIDNIKKLKQS